jgi:polyphenol oxidase
LETKKHNPLFPPFRRGIKGAPDRHLRIICSAAPSTLEYAIMHPGMKFREFRLEKLIAYGRTISVRFEPWERIPGLCQGVSIKDCARGPGQTYQFLSEDLGRQGFTEVRSLKQVHGKQILQADSDRPLGAGLEPAVPWGEGDGLVGRKPGVLGLITVADCVPVFLLDPRSLAWGLIHAGWRGCAAGIVSRGIEDLGRRFEVPPERLEVYLGPAVCGSCYEVGDEVVRALGPENGSGSVTPRPAAGKFLLDLRGVLAGQAEACGVRRCSIHVSAYCTICHNYLFHSFRVEGRAAYRRMWAFLGRAG